MEIHDELQDAASTPLGFHEAFFAVAARDQNRLAMCDVHGHWTYGETSKASRALASLLRSRGIGIDDVVIITADRSAAFVICLLGTLTCGARFLVMDREHFTLNLDSLLHALKPKLCIRLDDEDGDETPYRSTLAAIDSWVIRARSKTDLLRALGTHEKPPHIAGARLTPAARAYVLWTSGTTSAPKLVSTPHAPVCNFMRWYIGEFAVRSLDRFAMLSGLTHDPVIRDIFVPLSVGASIHIPKETTRMDAASLYAWLLEADVTIAHLTPTLLDRLASIGLAPLAHVRLLGIGGDRLTAGRITAAKRVFPNAEFVNFYGATETPQVMAFHRIHSYAGDAETRVPIGNGIPGAEILVLRDNGSECTPDEPGEIVIRSNYLAEGYIGAAPLTCKRFIVRSDWPQGRNRAYKTGDIGVRRDDGTVTVIGRKDRQVKINGHRVHLDDVELTLEEHASVARAAVSLDESVDQLVAHVVPAAGSILTENELRTFLETRAPLQHHPAKIFISSVLPVTRNGKTDYSALRAASTRYVEPAARSAHYGLLEEVWRKHLKLAHIEQATSFQELGGTSVQALRIAEEVSRRSGIAVRAFHLFVYPTLETFDAFVGAQLCETRPGPVEHADGVSRRNAIAAAKRRKEII